MLLRREYAQPMLDAQGQPPPVVTPVFVVEVHKHFEVWAELVGKRPTPRIDLPSDVVGHEVCGRQVVCFGMVAGVPRDDVLVVGKVADGAFLVRKRFKAHVLDHLQLLRRVNPDSAVPGLTIDVPCNVLDLVRRYGR